MKTSLMVAILVLCVCSACERQDAGKAAAPVYFDAQTWFQAEAKRLEAARPKVVKKVEMDDATEEMTTDALDYKVELLPFMDSALGRPAGRGRFSADTVRTAPDDFTVTYTTGEKSIPVKSLTIAFRSGRVVSVEVERSSKSLLAGSTQHLVYVRDEGFDIRMEQYALFGMHQRMRISVSFQK